MISGSRLEMVDLPRSVRDFDDVWTCFGVFQAPSLYSPGPSWQRGEWCPSQFMDRLLSEVFAW
jgi:hypothetical protein